MEWNHIQIPNGDTNLFCNCYVTGKSAMNIIVTHTPICTSIYSRLTFQEREKAAETKKSFPFIQL